MGALGGVLGLLVRSWGHLRCNLGHLRKVLEPLGVVLGPFWGVLGGSQGVLGRPWRLPGAILEAFLKDFRVSQAIYENSKRLGKTNGFSWIFEILEGFWGSKNEKN